MHNHLISHRQVSRFPLRLRATWLALFLCFFCAFAAAFAPSANAQDTYFLARQGAVLPNFGAYSYQGFTVSKATTFDLRYTSDYKSDCVILAPTYLNSFVAGGSYRYFAGFDDQFGTKRFTLAPGQYYVAIRNDDSSRNQYSYELDYALTSLAPDNNGSYAFSRWGISGATYVGANGGILYHGFSTTSAERTFLDGCNSGAETYIIPANQLSNVLGRRSFTYYTAYSGTTGELPGFYEITLPVGSYYLVFINRSSIAKAVTYQMEYWKRSNPVYLDLQAPASWNLTGNTVTIDVAKILNTSTVTTSGSLRLSLWALPSPYTGAASTGVNMANLDLSALQPRYQYTNIHSTLKAVRPSGSYYTTFILNEYTVNGWRAVDWINLPNRIAFDAKDTRGIGIGQTSSVMATGTPNPDSSIESTPLPTSRSTSALATRSAASADGSATQGTSVAPPPTISGTIGADVLIGKGLIKPQTKSASPDPSAGSS